MAAPQASNDGAVAGISQLALPPPPIDSDGPAHAPLTPGSSSSPSKRGVFLRFRRTVSEHSNDPKSPRQPLPDVAETAEGFGKDPDSPKQNRLSASGSFLRMRRPSFGQNDVFEFTHNNNNNQNDDEAGGRRMNMFTSVEDMKADMTARLLKPEYCVFTYYHDTGITQRIARHKLFENTTLGVIMFNALWIGIDTDYNDAATLLDAAPVFQVAEHFFCVYFFSEWLIRYLSFASKRNCVKDAWFVFDSVLVFMMVMETWVMTLILVIASGGSGGGGLGNASILRLVRLARLTRMLRMLRSMPELMTLVKGMASALGSVFFTLSLLMLVNYLFAIALVQLTAELDIGKKYFPAIATAIYRLIVHGTLLDSLSTVTSDIMGISSDGNIAFGLIFVLYVGLSALMVMNMLIGVLYEVVSAVSTVEKERMNITHVKNKMEQILGGNGDVSKESFMELLSNRDALIAFRDVGCDPVVIAGNVDSVFGDNDTLQFADFIEAVMRLKGSNQATVKDIIEVTKAWSGKLRDIEDKLLPEPSGRRKPRRSTLFGPSSASKEIPQMQMMKTALRNALQPVRAPASCTSALELCNLSQESRGVGDDFLQTMRLDVMLRATLEEVRLLQVQDAGLAAGSSGHSRGSSASRIQAWARTVEASLLSAMQDLKQISNQSASFPMN